MLGRLPDTFLLVVLVVLIHPAFTVPGNFYRGEAPVLINAADSLVPSTLYVSLCPDELYIWNDQIFITPGIYSETVRTREGLDSLIYLHLTVLEPIRTDLFSTICPESPLVWGGRIIGESGDFCDTLVSVTGCDSVVCMHVSIPDPQPVTMIGAALCPGGAYTWNGRDYREPGIYIRGYPSTSGCDSIVELRVSVLDEIPTTIVDTMIGPEMGLGGLGMMQWREGMHTDTLVSRFGCDSIVIYNVRFMPR